MATAEYDGFDFELHVVGVTHTNPGGRNRQKVVRDCSEGELVQLIPELDNKYDPNAIKVCRRNGEQIGYIDAGNAFRISDDLRRGCVYRVKIARILHKAGTRSYGLLLGFDILASDKESAARVQTIAGRQFHPDEIPTDREVTFRVGGAVVLLSGLWFMFHGCFGAVDNAAATITGGLAAAVAGFIAFVFKYKRPA